MMAYYFERKSVKWWRKDFLGVLEAMITNSYVLYSKYKCGEEADPEGVSSGASCHCAKIFWQGQQPLNTMQTTY